MKCEVVAVGTELLIGGRPDTNSTWIGEYLAASGIDMVASTVVADERDSIVAAINTATKRSDAVIVTGGLGPTQDDLTRDALASFLNVPLQFDEGQFGNIKAIFAARKRKMADSNRLQAFKPQGTTFIDQRRGTAPGLQCTAGDKKIYALPGVPVEMKEMMTRVVLPDLLEATGDIRHVLINRTLRIWGVSESELSEMVAERINVHEQNASPLSIAFLARGIEGIHLRLAAREVDAARATSLLDAEESELRVLLGPLVFGVDDQTMEAAVGNLLLDHKLFLGVAESLTGGLIAKRLTDVPGGSGWFRGGVVSYSSEVKHSVLGVPEGPVVTPEAAAAMADGVKRMLDCDIALSVTGVAGPTSQEGQPVGLVCGAVALPWAQTEVIEMTLGGERAQVREFACINILDALRRRMLAHPPTR